MKITEFISWLETIKAIHGDVEVVSWVGGHDAEPCYDFPETSRVMEADGIDIKLFHLPAHPQKVLFLGDLQ